MDLDCYTFKVLVKDGFIERMSKTKEGREYLEDAYYLTQTAPDREALRKHFGKGGN
jgi:predicted RNA polymerase sigma factor